MAGLVFRFARKRVSLVKLPKHSVNRRRRHGGGSTARQIEPQNLRIRQISGKSLKSGALPGLAALAGHLTAGPKSESAQGCVKPTIKLTPAADPANSCVSVQAAARALGRLPRKVKRRWSGFVGKDRVWRNLSITSPNGKPAYVYGAVRGKVVWSSIKTGPEANMDDDGWALGVVDATEVRIARDPNAVALGKVKLGVKEKPSELKAQTARTNGRRPCHPGRHRGRPPASEC
jgi:hypothetical protein